MDPRWRNLVLVLLLALIALVAWQFWLRGNSFFASASEGSVHSFKAGNASITAFLVAVPGFDSTTQQTGSAGETDLADVRQKISNLREQSANGPDFSEKAAVLSLADAWLSRLDVAIAWKKIQQQSGTVSFSGTEKKEDVCAQKEFFVSLRQQALGLQEKIALAEEKHNSFATNFPELAYQAGFAQTVSMRDEYLQTGNILLSAEKILGDCP